MSEVIYKEESYQVIGKCIEVHHQLGAGFLELLVENGIQIKSLSEEIYLLKSH